MALALRQTAELFHLVFLRALTSKSEDKTLVSLKGGCNLRFFFGSVRYSEDMDLDVMVISRETLKRKVERLLASPLVLAPLRSHGVDLVEFTSPKQTDTTQRWKIGLRMVGHEVLVRTKIEFSRRDDIEGALYEATPRELSRFYALTPVLATHYAAPAAIAQKIHALAGRTEPQARDVFDLSLLLARADAVNMSLSKEKRIWLPAAIENARSLSFDAYRAKVIAFLDPEQAALYQSRDAWNMMQNEVVAQLEALA
jgi:predicted nucleotidyltransferase component of viral defense system